MIDSSEKQKEFEQLWNFIKELYTDSEIKSFCSLYINNGDKNEIIVTTSNYTTYGD